MYILLLRQSLVAVFPRYSTGLQPQIKVTREKAMPACLLLTMPEVVLNRKLP